MASTIARVRSELHAFMAGGAFMPLWQAVMDATENVDDASELTETDRQWFDEVYDLVYMGGEDTPTEQTLQQTSTLRLRLRRNGDSVLAAELRR